MGSVIVGQAGWPQSELGGHRRDDADLARLSVTVRNQHRSDCRRASPLVFGRTTEMGTIRSLLDDVAHGGGAMVMSGQRGTGKTLLLDAADRAARSIGLRVVRINGTEFEADIPLAGVHQLLVTLSGEISELPGRARSAIEAAMDLGAGDPPGRLVVLNSVFALLRHAAARTPTMLIVDNAHWLTGPVPRCWLSLPVDSPGVISVCWRRCESDRTVCSSG